MVDTYIDVELSYPYAKVAVVLVVGGKARYELKEECGLTEQWMLKHTCSGIAKVVPEVVVIVLRKVLL